MPGEFGISSRGLFGGKLQSFGNSCARQTTAHAIGEQQLLGPAWSLLLQPSFDLSCRAVARRWSGIGVHDSGEEGENL